MSTLYRKHRPILFSEISGQSHIVQTLCNTIKNNRIGQAYLFTGSRGIGKTTLARIFSKTVNCLNPVKKTGKISVEPCNKCQNCLAIMENKTIDINEIDAASHTGVDNIRQLKENINLTPSLLKYKVYIIDEVHMLSIGAFNALLKTLEEPPAHAIFILATTELHKIPETIISRCQRFNFNRLTQEQIIERLKQIAKKEKVTIDDLALEIISAEAEGGMRDAESILNQIISLEDKKITGEEVSQILGTSSQNHIIEFIEKLLVDNVKSTLKQIEELQNEGIYLVNFNKTILSILRRLIIHKINPAINSKKSIFSPENSKKLENLASENDTQDLILAINLFQKSLVDSKNNPIPQLPLELAIIEFHLYKNKDNPNTAPTIIQSTTVPSIQKSTSTKITKIKKAVSKENPIIKKTKSKSKVIAQEAPIADLSVKTEKITAEKPSTHQENKTDLKLFSLILNNWTTILENIKPRSSSIHACLKSCAPAGIIENIFYIKTNYSFHKNRLNEHRNKLTIAEIVDKLTQCKIKVEIVTEDQMEDLGLNGNSSNGKDVLNDALQMMGGKVTE